MSFNLRIPHPFNPTSAPLQDIGDLRGFNNTLLDTSNQATELSAYILQTKVFRTLFNSSTNTPLPLANRVSCSKDRDVTDYARYNLNCDHIASSKNGYFALAMHNEFSLNLSEPLAPFTLNEILTSVAFHGNQHDCFAGTGEGVVYNYDAARNTLTFFSMTKETSPICCFKPLQPTTVLIGSGNGTLTLQDSRVKTPSFSKAYSSNPLVRISYNNQNLIALGYARQSMRLVDIRRISRELFVAEAHTLRGKTVEFCPSNPHRLISTIGSDKIQIWNVHSAPSIAHSLELPNPITSIQWSRLNNKKICVTTGRDVTVLSHFALPENERPWLRTGADFLPRGNIYFSIPDGIDPKVTWYFTPPSTLQVISNEVQRAATAETVFTTPSRKRKKDPLSFHTIR